MSTGKNIDEIRFSFVIPGRLAGLSWPEFAKPATNVAAYLKTQGISTLVNTTTGSYAEPVFSNEFHLVHYPMGNMTAPTMEQMDEILNTYLAMPENEAMAVHCMHGMGRTGTVIACILGKTRGLSAAQVIQAVRQKRPGSIESEEQERFIYQYLD